MLVKVSTINTIILLQVIMGTQPYFKSSSICNFSNNIFIRSEASVGFAQKY